MDKKEQPKKPDYHEQEKARQKETKKNEPVNKLFRTKRQGITVVAENKQSKGSLAMNALIRGESLPAEELTQAEKVTQLKDLDIEEKEIRAKISSANAGEGTGTIQAFKGREGFNERLRAIMRERKRLGL